ncbi:ABC transporter ATP-binding protein [Enterococcus dispar]|uniref:ABC transporter ATP-binding protein/permease n=1 Tax=Enterococcus dispar ATCC 51266 TaxID=1139219 RepID=S0KN64_9ENTE|nr:ABC transporter ATP-binding protein [Enterococcus dispar]EOT41463.1 ABC transporter ATP-binding protein/permease [Enterococcus dispar ATCC 51266]EOW86903.1 ABC transporter ATP-binding protein/permease [Enterococcus dispar ATCC 51266]
MKPKKIDWSVIKRFNPYLLSFKKEILLAVLLGIVAGGTSVYITYQIGQAVDQMLGKNQVNFAHLYHILLLFASVVLLTVFSQLFIQRLSNKIAYFSAGQLRKDAFTHLNKLPLSYYDQTPHGNIISRFTNDMDNIAIAVAAVFNQVFSGVAVVLIALVVMLRLNIILTCVVLVATPIIFFVSWLVATRSQANFARQQEIVGEISGFVTEMVGNQKIVKAFQQEAVNQTKFEVLNQELNVRGQKAQFSSSLTNPMSRFVDHLAYLAVGFVGGLLVLNGSELVTIGVISSFTIYASQFTKPFIELSGITTQIQTAIAGLNRTFEILDQKVETPDAPDAITLTKVKGAVSFEHVDFSYTKGQLLIRDFNFKTTPGETVAIVGKTGAGKSTLVNLLMRFYEVDAGKITLDGYDIRQLTRDSLRQSFGMVLQDTWLFDASLRENLTYGNPAASEKLIYDALKKTYMYDYVTRLPQKLNTIIGTSGVKISAGQRQLLSIARTMISQPHLLILDEATSSVDTLTERKIQAAFLAMMKGKTSFVIAHRLATIQAADKILVMDQGQIVEQGTHESLLAQNGYYAELYHAQFEQS